MVNLLFEISAHIVLFKAVIALFQITFVLLKNEFNLWDDLIITNN